MIFFDFTGDIKMDPNNTGRHHIYQRVLNIHEHLLSPPPPVPVCGLLISFADINTVVEGGCFCCFVKVKSLGGKTTL